MDAPQLPTVPEPPFWIHWTLERPLPFAVIAILAGLVLAWVLLTRGRDRAGGLLAVGAPALGVGVLVLGSLVTTPRERVVAATRALVAAIAEGDASQARALLDDRVRLYSRWSPAGWEQERIVQAVSTAEAGRIRSHSIREVRGGVPERGIARTLVRVIVEVDGWNAPIPSWWRIDWSIGPEGPRAVLIEPLWISGDNAVRGRSG